ncbi:MAG TPA: MetQ/NlpA family ABC transporter substrate-binding protein [Candidatus Dormibacteraeota bacterium]|nr:MetQ/NlpA family ABC transporter substrate-binding protein [Candidatus Dormibacteraeota bacterium]
MRKNIFMFAAIILLLTVLAACGSNNNNGNNANGNNESNNNALSEDKLIVGVTAGPHEEVFEIVKEVAAKDGLEIEIKVFSDYIIPNTALDEGQLDANSYQHKPFMDKFNEDHDTDLVSAFPTILSMIGVYSETLTDVNDIPEGGKIGIPNDPTNGARALSIFEEAGLIELDNEKRDSATPLDIVKNDKNIEFVELDAAQIPKMLGEVDLAVINGNFATSSGLNPTEDSIFTETDGTPYVNHLVVREENVNDPIIEKLKNAYYSDEVKDYINSEYPGVYQASW